jgi:hypothetical protein
VEHYRSFPFIAGFFPIQIFLKSISRLLSIVIITGLFPFTERNRETNTPHPEGGTEVAFVAVRMCGHAGRPPFWGAAG